MIDTTNQTTAIAVGATKNTTLITAYFKNWDQDDNDNITNCNLNH